MPITLDFDGKEVVYSLHSTVPLRSLKPDTRKSFSLKKSRISLLKDGKDSLDDNLIIHGDNLHALKALMPCYAGRVNCIYIDPPYNTGNKDWGYNDNVDSPMIKKWLEGKSPVDGEDLQRHDKWLCMMWPRLHLLWELLAENGVIFISIDDNEQHHLRMIMDEIFGEKNFVADFIWHHRKSSQNDIHLSLSHNYILCYAKNNNIFQLKREKINESKFSNPDSDPRGPWIADPMDAPNIRKNLTYPIVNPNTKKEYRPPEGRHWRFSQDKYNKYLEDNRIVFGKQGKTKPQYKRFLSDAKEVGQNVFTIWSDVETATDAKKHINNIFNVKNKFETPKPVSLIKKIINISADKNAIILDSFAGSGTTAQAVLALNKEDGGNRKFILVECEDYANKTTAERVRRVIKGVPKAKNENLKNGLSGSFTYCTLGKEISVENMLKGENLPDYETLARHLAYSTTGQTPDKINLEEKRGKDGSFFFKNKNYLFYLIYEPDLAFLESDKSALKSDHAKRIAQKIKKEDKTALVFATCSLVAQEKLSEMRIEFYGLPYGVKF